MAGIVQALERNILIRDQQLGQAGVFHFEIPAFLLRQIKFNAQDFAQRTAMPDQQHTVLVVLPFEILQE